jgi:lactoylglutathione lyase
MDHPATSDREGPAVRPHDVAFTVADLKRARAWYAAGLGFEIQFEFQPPGGGPAAMLHTSDGALAELFEVAEVSKGRTPGPAIPPRVGHVAFEVDDLDAVLTAATTAGGTELLGPRPAPAPGRRLAFVSDIDGNVLELIGPVEETGRE